MRKLNKILLPIGTIASVTVPVAMTVSCNMTKGFSVAIYNYEDYISEEGLNILNKDFNYKMFGDLPEFEQALKEGKTAGGIGSDYLNAKLAKQGELEKIDFYKALHVPKSVTNIEEVLRGTAPKYDDGYYTPAVWKQLSMFDSYIGDADHDGKPDHMWEYMVPYFT